jgi:hypothetical protein
MSSSLMIMTQQEFGACHAMCWSLTNDELQQSAPLMGLMQMLGRENNCLAP